MQTIRAGSDSRYTLGGAWSWLPGREKTVPVEREYAKAPRMELFAFPKAHI